MRKSGGHRTNGSERGEGPGTDATACQAPAAELSSLACPTSHSHTPTSPLVLNICCSERKYPKTQGLETAAAPSGLLVSVGWEFECGPSEFWLRVSLWSQSCGG